LEFIYTNMKKRSLKGAKISQTKRISFQEIVDRTSKIYGKNMFDYSELEYENCNDIVKIKCKKHNFLFEQFLSSHLKGHIGCDQCKKEFVKKSFIPKNKKTTEKFIEEHKEYQLTKYKINYYNYSEVEYINNTIKVKIICPHHGAFYTKNTKTGCRECFVERKKLTQEEFIERSIKIHKELQKT